jgi:hypothetical protein
MGSEAGVEGQGLELELEETGGQQGDEEGFVQLRDAHASQKVMSFATETDVVAPAGIDADAQVCLVLP